MQHSLFLFKTQSSRAGTLLMQFSSKAKLNTFSQKKSFFGDMFPDKLLKKKHKTPAAFYLTHKDGADLIIDALKPHLKNSKCDTVLELNPGIGLLTRHLLELENILPNIILMESTDHFVAPLHDLLELYSNRLKFQYGDLLSLWKLYYQDRQDAGSRVNELLENVPRKAFDDDPNVVIIGAVGTYSFFKHMINSLVFQNGLMALGRPEMYLIMPPPIYIHLTCSNEIGYMLYRSNSMLFQMMFEYRFISKIPREYFLPEMADVSKTKNKKMVQISSLNPEDLFLVKIVPRRNLFDLCPPVDLPALWYFSKQNCISRRNCIIPNLEKWIPGCGPRLIINTKPTESVKNLFLDEDLTKLPKFCKPCTTMTRRDLFPNLNIFTQFGDLSPSQMLSLFMKFRNWPEYSESSFLASFESSMLKMETSPDENIDGINIAEEDDVNSNDLQEMNTEEDTDKNADVQMVKGRKKS